MTSIPETMRAARLEGKGLGRKLGAELLVRGQIQGADHTVSAKLSRAEAR
jgi:hypothetical protein